MNLKSLIAEKVKEVRDVSSMPGRDVGEDSRLFGPDGELDSMGLVYLVVALEEHVLDEYGVSISLADERAMSRNQSPFRTVAALADYMEELLCAEGINV